MSESGGKDSPPKAFSAFAFESHNDPDTLSLSDSDPALSDEAEVTSLSPGEEEDEEEDSRQEEEQKPFTLPFTLKGTNASFSMRSDDIFGGLLDVQKTSPLIQQTRKREVADDVKGEISDVPTEKVTTGIEAAPVNLTSKSSTSAKPSGPSGRLPDYLAHPERWTKYSLENVPDTSDRTNRNTALNFLTELKQQKEAQEVPKATSKRSYNQGSASSGEGRILFSKPTKKVQQSSDKGGVQPGPLDMLRALTEEVIEDSEVPGEQAEAENLGFHGVKKRVRKNIRPKTAHEEGEGEAS